MGKNKVITDKTVSASAKLQFKDALELVGKSKELYVCKGKNVTYINLKAEKPHRKVLESLLLGPMGNLRAPTSLIGKTMIVGFDLETFKKLIR